MGRTCQTSQSPDDRAESFKSVGKGIGKYLGIVAFAVASQFASQQAEAQQPADIIIDGTWSFTEINNLLDNDSQTKGKNNTSDPLPWSGDIVEFEGATTYSVPAQFGSPRFVNRIPGITVRCEDNLTTILQASVIDEIIFTNYAAGFRLLNCKFANSSFGFNSESGDPSNPVVVQGNIFEDINEKAIIQEKIEVIGANTAASLKVYDNLFDGVKHAMSGPRGPPYYAMQQPWIEARGNTAIGVTGRLFVPPVVFSNTASVECAFGMDSFVNNVYDDSSGIAFEDTVIGLPDCAGFLSGTVAAGAFAGPARNLENEIGYQPQSGDTFAGYLTQFYPTNENTVADPLVTCFLRPLKGSPLLGPQYTNVDGSARGFRGAKAPFGDWDGNGIVDEPDQVRFVVALNRQNSGETLTERERNTFYVNCDGPIDVGEFYKLFQGTLTIPAVSAWGLVVLALGSLIAGTLVLSRRRQPTDTLLATPAPR